MVELPVHDRQGNVVETIQFDETCFGTHINMKLLHAAIVMYEANRRQGTHATKTIREVVGTSRKPHPQKHTGRARMGSRRRHGNRGGGTVFGPKPRDYRQSMPRQARRQALKSALLGKIRDGELVVLSEFDQNEPKTKDARQTLDNLNVGENCLVVVEEPKPALWMSLRNLSRVDLATCADLNAYSVLRRKNLLLTRAALEALSGQAMAKEAS